MRRLRVLGPLEVDGAAEVLGPRDRVVVSVLALRPGERVDAETLAEALWGEEPPASAAKVVQGCVSRLRKTLGTAAIETVDGGYRVRCDELDIDRLQFEDQVERARGYLATRTPERAIPLLNDALALWRGPAFRELEDWMPGRLEAVRLGQLCLAAEEDLLQARLDCGDHVGVAADGTVLAGQQPFRERRWALLALAQYRSGRQADALGSIRAARRALGQELGLDPGSELVALESRILAQDPGLATDHEARVAGATCPWKGLAPYGDRDGDTFFGRADDIAACLARLGRSPLLVVTGPSGSGKSSLVQAGLVPALRESGAEVEVFTPGADGAMAMAAARSRRPGDPLLVIDQFEESFTLRGATFSRPWLGELARYAEESAAVVLVVRGDHVAELGVNAELARLAERGLHLVTPLSGDRLREAVEGPARVAGLRLEPGLVDLIVRDADGQPGALPLLSHALAETWQRREAGLLTVDGYRAAGGISDAVAASAERLYEGLTRDERSELRWLMLRLVSLSEGGEAFRTPLPSSVVAALAPVRRRLLDLLVRGRLVTSADGGYDLAHEALVRAWPRLRVWLDEDRVGQQIRRHLAMAAAGWEALDRPEGELYRGARLGAALEWLERGQEPLDVTQRAFIEASRAVADDDVRRLADEARRQRRQNRRLRVLVAVSVVLLVVAAAAGVVARDQGLAARRGEESATASAASARHEALVARSLALRSTDLAAAALLAVHAWRDMPDASAESALIGSITSASGFLGRGESPGAFAAAAALPGDNRLLLASGTAVRLLNPETGEVSNVFPRSLNEIEVPSVLRVSDDGTRAVQLINARIETRCPPSCPVIVVYDLQARQVLGQPLEVGFAATDIAVSADGGLVSAAGGSRRGGLATWDTSTGGRLSRARSRGTAITFGAGDQLFLAHPSGPIQELSARDLRVHGRLAAPRRSADQRLLFVRGLLVAAGERGQLVHDLERQGRSWFSSAHGCETLAVSTAQIRVYCGTVTGSVEERDLRTGQSTGRVLDPQFGPLRDLVVYDQGGGAEGLVEFQKKPNEYARRGVDGPGTNEYARWRVDGPGIGARLLAQGAAVTAGYDPSNRLVLATRDDRTEVLDATTGSVALTLPAKGPAVWLSPTIIGVVARRPWLIHVPSGRVVRPPLDDVVGLFPERAGTHAWAVSRDGDATRVRRFSLEGRLAQPEIVLARVEGTQVTADSGRVLVTYRKSGVQGNQAEWEVSEHDGSTGEQITVGLQGSSHLIIGPDGLMVVANEQGKVETFADMFGTDATSLPPAQAAVSSLQLSDDKRRLLVTSADRAVQLIDWETRSRLGDPIDTDTPVGVPGGWLRHDGDALLTNSSLGIIEWDLRPAVLAEAACLLAGRNLQRHEWVSFIGADVPEAPTCPQYE